MKKEMTYSEKMREGKTPSKVIKIEGVGTAKIYGEWDAEKLIKRLLKSESIMKGC
jgi:hypothetical protein